MGNLREPPARGRRVITALIGHRIRWHALTQSKKGLRKNRRKVKKPSIAERLKHRAQETANLGTVLKNEPKSFPAACLKLLNRWVRSVWNARGGGLYACGFVVTFVWLEASMFFAEIVGGESIASFFEEQLLEFLIRFSMLSIQNTISAFMWPVYIINYSPAWGGISLAAMFVPFDKFIKNHLDVWLLDHKVDVDGPAEGSDSEQDGIANIVGERGLVRPVAFGRQTVQP